MSFVVRFHTWCGKKVVDENLITIVERQTETRVFRPEREKKEKKESGEGTKTTKPLFLVFILLTLESDEAKPHSCAL